MERAILPLSTHVTPLPIAAIMVNQKLFEQAENLDILNKCSPIEPGMMGCCCNGDACIDPYKGRTPKDPLTCFAGVNVPQDNYTVGDLVSCDGMCISVQTRVMGKSVTVYQCTSKDVCVVGLCQNKKLIGFLRMDSTFMELAAPLSTMVMPV